MVLGDRFPEPERLASVRRQLTPWRVIRLFCKFTLPPKEKRLLVVHVATEVHVLVINSTLAPFIQGQPRMLQCQVALKKTNHTFLRVDSFLDCTRTYSIPAQEIERQLVTELGRIQGEIAPKDRQAVVEAIRRSTLIERRVKAVLLASLDPTMKDKG